MGCCRFQRHFVKVVDETGSSPQKGNLKSTFLVGETAGDCEDNTGTYTPAADHMQTVTKNYGETNFVTGMRAIAALGVLLIHAGGGGLRELGVSGNRLADLGSAGVLVFFVISGFSVTASFKASAGYFDYLGRRLWRIAPLYYFWILIALLSFSSDTSLYNLLMHLGFVSFLDHRIANSILGVEWSISIEVFWYVVVPALIVCMHNKKNMALACASALLIYLMAERNLDWLPIKPADARRALQWSPIPYVLSYCLGVTAYQLRDTFANCRRFGDAAIFFAVAVIAVLVILPGQLLRFMHNEFVVISSLSFMLLLLGSEESRLFRLIFTNRIAQFLGVMSYGIYLSHVPMISLLTWWNAPFVDNPTVRFVMVACAATAVSFFTFHAVERPGLALGAFFRWRRPRAA